jgi:hypothetical protein
MFGNDRNQMRRIFTDAWSKHRNGSPLEPIEKIIADIIQHHPEYHSMLEQADLAIEKDFLPEAGEANPFLHLSMHVSIQEQISTDRPPGITAAYKELVMGEGDAHQAEHMMMDCIGQMIWEAQRSNRAPNEQAYLACINKLIIKHTGIQP